MHFLLRVVIAGIVFLFINCVIALVGTLDLIWMLDEVSVVRSSRNELLTLVDEEAVDSLLFKARLRFTIHNLFGLASHDSLIRMMPYGSTLSLNHNEVSHFYFLLKIDLKILSWNKTYKFLLTNKINLKQK